MKAILFVFALLISTYAHARVIVVDERVEPFDTDIFQSVGDVGFAVSDIEQTITGRAYKIVDLVGHSGGLSRFSVTNLEANGYSEQEFLSLIREHVSTKDKAIVCGEKETVVTIVRKDAGVFTVNVDTVTNCQ